MLEEYACGNCILRQESKADEEVSEFDIAHGAAEIKAKIGKTGGNVEVYGDVELDKKMEEDVDHSIYADHLGIIYRHNINK